jgi:nucleoside-diphosphate-sugar epimerase
MKYTILGASGFVGSHLVASLLRSGHEVFAPSRDDKSIFGVPLGHAVYCIGLTADYRSRPFDTVEAHISILNALLRDGVFESLTYLSSTRVYLGGTEGAETERISVSSLDASDLYNITKLAGEAICFASARANVRAIRLSNVIGLDTGSSNFVFDICREALKGHVRLRSDLASAKDYIGIDDVTDLLPRIAASGKERLYNLASGIQVSHQVWLAELARLTGCTFEAESGSPLTIFPAINIARIQTEFGYRPRSVTDYLPRILESLTSSTS